MRCVLVEYSPRVLYSGSKAKEPRRAQSQGLAVDISNMTAHLATNQRQV